MGKKLNKKDVFKHQLKTVEKIGERVQALIDNNRKIKGYNFGTVMRTVVEPNDPTIYKKGRHVKGIRETDYKFSKSDPNIIEKSNEHGLSFSSTMKHTLDTIEFLAGFQKKGTRISCAYWIIEDSKMIPEDMAFVQDPYKDAHYLLVITKNMHIDKLVSKLQWIEQRMSVMNDLPLGAYKYA